MVRVADYGRFATLRCGVCAHMLLEREQAPTEPDDYKVASNDALRRMLKSTRDEEFSRSILMVASKVRGGTWLDIGCSYGWFLDKIAQAGYTPFGVEPSPTAFAEAHSLFSGSTLNGEFPTVLEENASFPRAFDVLSTMDVLEHIQDPRTFLQAAREYLAPDGVFLIKVPSNEGLLFHLFSSISNRRHNHALSRMWQVDFNYPHWHYYSSESIRRMLAQHGFSIVSEQRLPFAFFATAVDRVRSYEAGRENLFMLAAKTVVAYALVSASYLLRRFDNIVVLAQTSEGGRST